MPYIANSNDYISISRDFVTNNLPAANATYVKIYLYILALSGENVEYSQIADKLSVLESDVINAVRYWIAEGVLFDNDGTISFTPAPSAETPRRQFEVQKSDYTPEKVSDAVIASPELRDMLAVAEELLQKPITPPEMETLYWFYDGLGLSPEAVLMLLEYCVDKGKPRLSYAEKVALSWCERGLTTAEDISNYLRDIERKSDDVKQITAAMGISSRPLAKGEEEYFSKWLGDFNMSREMVLLAHEYCIMQTGKLSFQYIDRIMERWANEGITTTAAAQAQNDAHRKNNKADAPKGNEYEYTDIENVLRNK